ncbi:MAG: NAD-dependent epimerase/dehydratase family protein [Rhodothermaceae bacterium]|nr:NAD-dependent epimerase/dehydratase family protein [Rhodothermaceae bacterium]
MRILAIGATGFIGRPTVVRLLAEGHTVWVVHRGQTTATLPESVRSIHGERASLAAYRSALEPIAPDVVLDVIPYTEEQASALMALMRGLAGRVVALSSADVYRNYEGFRGRSNPPPTPELLAESAPLREHLYPYRDVEDLDVAYRATYDKILVERAVLGEPTLPGTVLRLPAVYGEDDRQRRLQPYLQRMRDHRPAILLGAAQARWRWSRGYVENVAAAIALAVTDERAANRIYNVADDPALTEERWVQQMAKAIEWQGAIRIVPDDALPPPLQQPFHWNYDLALDTRRIRTELGYREPVAWRAALERSIAWTADHEGDSQHPDYTAEDAVLARFGDA